MLRLLFFTLYSSLWILSFILKTLDVHLIPQTVILQISVSWTPNICCKLNLQIFVSWNIIFICLLHVPTWMLQRYRKLNIPKWMCSHSSPFVSTFIYVWEKHYNPHQILGTSVVLLISFSIQATINPINSTFCVAP